MKGKKLLAGLISAAMVMGTMILPAFADESKTPNWDANNEATVVAYGIGSEGNDKYFTTLKEALNAVYMSTPKDVVTLECKGDADVGAMTHAHVEDDLIIKVTMQQFPAANAILSLIHICMTAQAANKSPMATTLQRTLRLRLTV